MCEFRRDPGREATGHCDRDLINLTGGGYDAFNFAFAARGSDSDHSIDRAIQPLLKPSKPSRPEARLRVRRIAQKMQPGLVAFSAPTYPVKPTANLFGPNSPEANIKFPLLQDYAQKYSLVM